MKNMPALQSSRTNPKFNDLPNEIPFSLLSERMAMSNHYQSLGRLAERGGMCYEEIAANLLGVSWSDVRLLTADQVANTIIEALNTANNELPQPPANKDV